jgi:hypothetical protein
LLGAAAHAVRWSSALGRRVHLHLPSLLDCRVPRLRCIPPRATRLPTFDPALQAHLIPLVTQAERVCRPSAPAPPGGDLHVKDAVSAFRCRARPDIGAVRLRRVAPIGLTKRLRQFAPRASDLACVLSEVGDVSTGSIPGQSVNLFVLVLGGTPGASPTRHGPRLIQIVADRYGTGKIFASLTGAQRSCDFSAQRLKTAV